MSSAIHDAKLSVIIPTLNAAKEIGALLDSIFNQSLVPCEVIVVDSESDDSTCDVVRMYENVHLIQIKRAEFNHGLTRDMAFRESMGDFVCFMTQDAIPADGVLFENLVAPMLEDDDIALVTARQLPKEDARRFEQLVRNFNYPDEQRIRTKADLSKYGIKTFFASDVCALYRRTTYLESGGFQKVVTYEDMIMAATFINTGYKVLYEPKARVYHSHNLTPSQQYQRNRDGGRCLQEHKTDLMCTSDIKEGSLLVKFVIGKLLQEARFGELLSFGVDCIARFFGNRAGRRAVRKGL